MSDTSKQQEQEASVEEDAPLEDTSIEDAPAEDAPVEDAPVEDTLTGESQADREPVVENVPDDLPGGEPPAASAPVKAGGKGVAWLALIVSVAAFGAVGYTLYQDWRTGSGSGADETLTAFDNRLAETRKTVTALDGRIAELDTRDGDATAGIDALKQELDERVRLLSSLPARMSALESSVSSLAGISEGARDTWLLAEAEYYMQIANAQLQLANNPHLASLALAMADERVVQLANPALTDVRRAIADELAALAVMEKPDIAGTTLTLASLARVVESLPLRSPVVTDSDPEPLPDEEQGSVDRAWASVKGAMSGLVKVTPPDQAKLELLTPDAEYFLRSNIALQLQAARLALLRGEQTVFEQTLDDTSSLLVQYFDTDSTQVSAALQTLEEVRSNVLSTTAPDISASLDLLRQFQTLRENSQ